MITEKPYISVDNTIEEIYGMIERHKDEPELVNVFGGKTMQEIFDFISKRIKYLADPMKLIELNGGSIELLRSPKYTLIERAGDCDCKSILAGSLFASKKVPFRLVVTSSKPDKQLHHIYIDVLVRNPVTGIEDWKPFDATYPENELWKEKDYTKKIAYYLAGNEIHKQIIKA